MKILTYFFPLLIIFCFRIIAQPTVDSLKSIKTKNPSFSDSINYYQLKEVEIISTRYVSKIKDISVPIEIADEKEILKNSGTTPSDLLKSKPGVSVSRDGIWGTFISIRGLSKNNIVVLVDGNRIETSNDIDAGLSLIDVNDINRIEVIKSAASSLYGSGALGGVVNIISQNGFYPESIKLNVSSLGSYNSVNNNSSGTISFNLGNQNWFVNLKEL